MGLLAGVGANPLAGTWASGTGPVINGNASMDRDLLPFDLAARIARLLTSEASAMIHNRLDVDSTFPSTLPHQRDALGDPVPSGVRSCQDRLACFSAKLAKTRETLTRN